MELERCRAAALVLIDDNSLLESTAGTGLPWSPQVRPLVASPIQLARRTHILERSMVYGVDPVALRGDPARCEWELLAHRGRRCGLTQLGLANPRFQTRSSWHGLGEIDLA